MQPHAVDEEFAQSLCCFIKRQLATAESRTPITDGPDHGRCVKFKLRIVRRRQVVDAAQQRIRALVRKPVTQIQQESRRVCFSRRAGKLKESLYFRSKREAVSGGGKVQWFDPKAIPGQEKLPF